MFRSPSSAIAVLAALLALVGCAGTEPSTVSVSSSTLAAATISSGPYLGQQPPGMTPEVFAPGIVSDPSLFEYSGTFSRDGSEYSFDPMAGGAYVSPDGQYLFFGLKDDIWWVDSKVIDELRPEE